ncbi:MAG: hypothetical protein M1814_005859 [Vezdaea aestivalis]|nr:MAG: hypothetical protein M1814_005859 [Vezdaea aestivalis]
MPAEDRKKPGMTISTRSRNSSESSGRSLKSPRTPRFVEATAVNSPIEPSKAGRSPFADPVSHHQAQPQPADVGFGYISEQSASRHQSMVPVPEGPKSPLKSAMKSPGSAPRAFTNPLSPTFREEDKLEDIEKQTDKENVKDLRVKTRVRMAKMLLRGVNFSCSLVILSMLAATFTIFNATRHLAPRNNLPAWAPKTKIWPQVTLLVIACVSLAVCIGVFYGYWKGGHKRAEKVAVYYTVFAASFFVISIVIWGVAAGILVGSKQNSNGQDIWGWSCKDNKRQQLFSDSVSYSLVCRMQNWSLICIIIEVVVETITILIYAVVFYRFYSKNRLRKTMDMRDKARSDLYLAQLRVQSAPNTPGFAPQGFPGSPRFGPASPRFGPASPRFPNEKTPEAFASSPRTAAFNLQPPPIRIQEATPTAPQGAFAQPLASPQLPPERAPVAPGEQMYDAVPIPGAYQAPMSPGFAPGMAVSTDERTHTS